MTQMLQQSDKYFKIAITIMLEECLKSEKQQKKGRKEGKNTVKKKNRQIKSLELKTPICAIKTSWMILRAK